MGDFQQKDMEGVLFKNDDATPENKQPAFSGSFTIKGVKYNLGAWVNTSKKSGRKFMSLRISPWGKKKTPSTQNLRSVERSDFQDDSDLPF